MTNEIAIIGDRFMRSDYFAEALKAACGARVTCKTLDLPWPDEPMEHGYASPGLEGLKEYLGAPDTVLAHIGSARGLITHLAPMSRAMFTALPELQFIAVARGGPVNIDMKAAAEHRVRVVNVPGRNASAVAEFTIGLIIDLTRNITRGHDGLRQGDWRGDLYRADLVGNEVSDMTVGVIGYGHVGRHVVRLLRAFGARVLVADPYVQLDPADAADGVVHCALTDLLAESDLVTLHPRVTPETTGMIGADALAAMKPGAFLVNTARGPLMDYDALLDALNRNHLRGAGLETFAVEPLPVDAPLRLHPNVTLTPHIAGASLKTIKIAAAKTAEETRRWLSGEPPLNPC